MKAIRVHAPGGRDALKYEEVPEPKPGPGQAVLKLHAIGVNFIDVYHRTGLYKLPLPFTPGMEGAGVVESVGPDVIDGRNEVRLLERGRPQRADLVQVPRPDQFVERRPGLGRGETASAWNALNAPEP